MEDIKATNCAALPSLSLLSVIKPSASSSSPTGTASPALPSPLTTYEPSRSSPMGSLDVEDTGGDAKSLWKQRSDSLDSVASTQCADEATPSSPLSSSRGAPIQQLADDPSNDSTAPDVTTSAENEPQTSTHTEEQMPPQAHHHDDPSETALTLLALSSLGGSWGRPSAPKADAHIGSARWPPVSGNGSLASILPPAAAGCGLGGSSCWPPAAALPRFGAVGPTEAEASALSASSPRVIMAPHGAEGHNVLGQQPAADGDHAAAPKLATNMKRRANEDERIRHFGWRLVKADAGQAGGSAGHIWVHPVHGTATSKKAIFRLHANEPPVKKPRTSHEEAEGLEPAAAAYAVTTWPS